MLEPKYWESLITNYSTLNFTILQNTSPHFTNLYYISIELNLEKQIFLGNKKTEFNAFFFIFFTQNIVLVIIVSQVQNATETAIPRQNKKTYFF